jgi:hypothetical protein
MESLPHVLAYHKIIVFMGVTILALLTIIILLIRLYVRKDKAYELTKFSMTNKEFGIVIELNKDKKMEHLVLENNTLRQEIEGLKAQNERQRLKSFGYLLLLFVILLLDRLDFKKLKITHIDKKTIE